MSYICQLVLTSKIFGPNIFGHLIFGQKISDKIFQDFGQNFGQPYIRGWKLWMVWEWKCKGRDIGKGEVMEDGCWREGKRKGKTCLKCFLRKELMIKTICNLVTSIFQKIFKFSTPNPSLTLLIKVLLIKRKACSETPIYFVVLVIVYI